MKTCLNCGKKLEKDEMFCTECGTRAPVDTVETQKKFGTGNKNKLFLIGGVAIVLVLVLILTQTVFASPAKKFKKYQQQFFVEMAMGTVGDYVGMYEELTNFSTDVTISAETDQPYLESMLDGTSLVLKGEVDKNKAAVDATVNLMGNDVVSGYLSYDAGKVAFYLPEFDKALYEVDLTKSNPVNDVLDLPAGIENLEVPTLDTKTMTKLTKEYLGLLLDIANKDNTSVEKGTNIRLVGLHESVKGDLYVVEPTAEEIEATMLAFAAQIKDDENLRTFITNSLGSNQTFFKEMGIDFEDELDFAIDSFCEEVEDNSSEVAESLEDAGLRWELAVSGGDICYNALIIEEDGMTYNAYEDSVAVFNAYQDEMSDGIVLEYEKEGKLYDGSLEIYEYGEVAAEFEFEDVNLKNKSSFGINHGTYRFIETYYDEEIFELEVVAADNGGTDHMVEVEGVTIIVNTTDKASTISKPKASTVSLNDFSRRELEELAYDLEEYFYNVGEALNDIM